MFFRFLIISSLLVGCSKPPDRKWTGLNSGGPVSNIPLEEVDYTAQENLGKVIFNDTRLSEPSGVSCASCHDSSKAFTGNNGSAIAAVALGSTPGSFGSRNVPQLTYASFFVDFGFYPASDIPGMPLNLLPFGGQFWDGRALNFREQVRGPLLSANEMNNPSVAAVVAKIQTASYVNQFKAVCGSKIFDDADKAFDCLSEAIAAFEQSSVLSPFTSKFDFYLQGKAELTALETQGFALFKNPNKGNCISCHKGKEDSNYPPSWQFTDHGYDSIGTPRNFTIPANFDPAHFDLGLCEQPGLAAKAPSGTDISTFCTHFKNPSLRNVALTAPYGHNGFFQTLTDVVNFYATRDTNPELWYSKDTSNNVVKFDDAPVQYQPNINKQPPFDLHQGDTPRLDASEVSAIVAFLNTLTDGYSP